MFVIWQLTIYSLTGTERIFLTNSLTKMYKEFQHTNMAIYFWFGLHPLPESTEKVEKKTKDGQDVNKEPLEEQAFVEQHANQQIPEDQAEEQAAKNQNGGSPEIQRNANSREIKHIRLV